MKCIRVMNTPKPIRVSNEKAEELVLIGLAEYCSKDEWKRRTRNPDQGLPVNVPAFGR